MGTTKWRTLSLDKPASDVDSNSANSVYYNRKQREPSKIMHAPDGYRYRCSWIENGITLQSDGNVTCGLDDPYSRRSFGNINEQSVRGIWANPEYIRLQQKMWQGHRCIECNLAQPADDSNHPMPTRPNLPTTLVVETTVRCNLRCPQQACIPNNDRTVRTRDADFLNVEVFERIANELANNLDHVFFFNYGDPFVHSGAAKMLSHLHRTSPNASVTTSTNGIPLSNIDRAREVVSAQALDLIVFTISGVTQENYCRYHVGGRLDLAMRGMANVLQAKRELGLERPIVHWRYLVFKWNDSEAEIEEALCLAKDYGVDEFSLHLTHVPLDAISYRFSPGSPNFLRYRKYIQNALGYTRVSPMPDENGIYKLEETALGPARWTGWQARKRLNVVQNLATITVSTSRPTVKGRADHVFIRTPWYAVKVPLQPDAWRSVDLTVPYNVQPDSIEVEIVTFDYWFPAEEYGSTDQRCLGVLIREDFVEDKEAWKWQGFEEINTTDAMRLANFRYSAPELLIDW